MSKCITEFGYNGVTKAMTGCIISAFASLSSIPYLESMLKFLREVVIKPSMFAIPSSLIIYTLVKEGLLDQVKYKTVKDS